MSHGVLSYAPKPGPSAEPKPLNQPGLPRDLYELSIPAGNPQTPEKVALGKTLFFDTRCPPTIRQPAPHATSPI